MMNTLDELVGRRLRMRRRLLGLSQRELGARVGLRFQQIHKLECGATRITCARLFDLANALGLAPDSLLEGLADACRGERAEQQDLTLVDLSSQGTAMSLLRAFHRMDKARQRALIDIALVLGGEADRSAAPLQARAS
jgi:transcriptional regulator with XRE-family HTH domain